MPTLLHSRTRTINTYGKKRTRVISVAVDLPSDDEVQEVLSPLRKPVSDKENIRPGFTVHPDSPPTASASPKASKTFKAPSPARRRRRPGHLLPLPSTYASPKRPPLSTRSSNDFIRDALVNEVATIKPAQLNPTKEAERTLKSSVISISSTDEAEGRPTATAQSRVRGVPKRTRASSARQPKPIIDISSDNEVEEVPARTSRKPARASDDVQVVEDEAVTGLTTRLRSSRLGHSTSSVSAPEPVKEELPQAGPSKLSCSTRSQPSIPTPAPLPFSSLLSACKQTEPMSFDYFVENVGQLLTMSGASTTKPRWTKLAEASFSEVYAVSTSAAKRPALEDIVVVKALPLRGEPVVDERGELVEVPQETEACEAERELAISKLLGECDGFVRVLGAFVVSGAYPTKLVATWDAFADKRAKDEKHDPSECNVRPDTFPSSQHYLLLCLPHSGTDLEHFRLSSWTEATSILWQVALSLAKAERSHAFEHRDLHWGNITIARLPPDAITLALAQSHDIPPAQALAALSIASPVEWPVRLNGYRTGVRATVIDYTLSRSIDSDGQTLFHPFDDEELFTGQGDMQFDLYRQMRQVVGTDWSVSKPVTNVMWLYYLADKLVDGKGLSTPTLPGLTSASSTPRRGLQTVRDQARSRALAHAEMEAYSSLLAAKYALRGHVDRTLKPNAKGRPRLDGKAMKLAFDLFAKADEPFVSSLDLDRSCMSLFRYLTLTTDRQERERCYEELERALDGVEDQGRAHSYNLPPDVDADEPSPLLAQHQRKSQQARAPPARPQSQLEWLRANLPTPDLLDRTLACLTSAASDEAIQDQLLDIFGFDRIDLLPDAIGRREAIRQEAIARDQQLADALSNGPGPASTSERPASPDIDAQVEAQIQQRFKANLARAKEDALPSLQRNQPADKRGYLPQSQIVITSSSDKKRAREERKAAIKRRKQREAQGDYGDIDLSAEDLERIRLEVLEANAQRPLFDPTGIRVEEQPKYPHVYAASNGGGLLSFLGQRYTLPPGTTRHEHDKYWEVTIPTPNKLPMREGEELIRIGELDPMAKGSFPGYETLNRLQSLVYPIAYNTNENMLVCAPTGAGKTDVAMLTVLRALSQHAEDPRKRPLVSASDFKVIYVAPMKALAAEIVRKMSKRLSWLGIVVKELTGDMQLTRAEIAATHFIVTTPEKWDVVTRKPEGDAELASKVRLLIIDEVHLLHDDRGAVIESIVARTLRQVESSQALIRIVGLSATLPNYIDVADFLRVNRYQGLFYFDSSFRPVPLEQHFLGVKGKAGSQIVRNNLDEATFDKVSELIRGGHQVMVFVHSRKDTVKTAEYLQLRCKEEPDLIDLIDPKQHPRYELFKRDLIGSRNRELKELFEQGFGIHHAGMLRSDRNMSERFFEQDVTKVLVCTATLAWGVNLPAYAVVIKGTQIFDSAKGSFTDLSILDVLQIFGRAGRPQYETHGVGYICTSYDRLDHYVSAITQQHPIESKFESGLLDSLNAEIALGTVTSIDAGVRWIGYTYLFVRMRKNPLWAHLLCYVVSRERIHSAYGLTVDELMDDPALGSKRHLQISSAIKRLVDARMVLHDVETGALSSTELGTIASKYYLRYASIENFNRTFRASMSEADVLAVISSSVEFDQLKVRDSEVNDLQMMEASESVAPCKIKGGVATTPGKVNVLLQAYISRTQIHDFALISDCGYVAQNAGRITRALLDIAISRRWSATTAVLVGLSKAIEKRMWPFEHPLAQLQLPNELLYNVKRYIDDYEIADLIEIAPVELGKLLHLNERFGSMTRAAARQVPYLVPSIRTQPVTHDLLRVCVGIERRFDWTDRLHGRQEPFWLWISDEEDREILRLTRLYVFDKPLTYSHDFVVSVASMPSKLHLRIMSERWLGSEEITEIDLLSATLPPSPPSALPLLDLPLLRLGQTEDQGLLRVFGQSDGTLDPVMTQGFHSLYHSSASALFCVASPTNWQLLLELAIWWALSTASSGSAIVVSPHRLLTSRLLGDLHRRFAGHGITVSSLSGKPEQKQRIVVVASPEAAMDLCRREGEAEVRIICAPYLHLLDEASEMAIARLRHRCPAARVVGTSFPLSDARDMASFLGVPSHHTYSFAPSSIAEPVETVFHSFSTPHSAALLHAMVIPTFEALASAEASALCVVPTRGQCRNTARDLVTLIGAGLESDGFLGGAGQGELEVYAGQLNDASFSEALIHGVGVWHDGLSQADQRLILQLYATRSIRVLILPRELIWSVPIAVSSVASLTVVMGAQTIIASTDSDSRTRQVRDYSLGELVQLTQLARAPASMRRCVVMCQAEQAELYARYLRTGLPLESRLLDQDGGGARLLRHMVAYEVVKADVKDRQDIVDLLSWTYLAQRLRSNPDFYDSTRQDLSSVADEVCGSLRARGLVRLPAGEAFEVQATELAKRVVKTDVRSLDAVERVIRLGVEGATKLLDGLAVEVVEAKLKDWQSRLKKSTREALEADDATPTPAQVLLAGYFSGRTPNDVDLERAQADVVEVVMKRV